MADLSDYQVLFGVNEPDIHESAFIIDDWEGDPATVLDADVETQYISVTADNQLVYDEEQEQIHDHLDD